MAHSALPTIAYYTVVDDERTGWTGGLLLLNKGGRPLEFQCTLPVRPTKAHEILYGVTLRQHLIGEVIGPLLIQKCRTPISILCCDQWDSLSLASTAGFPVAIVREAIESSTREKTTANAMPESFEDSMATVLLAGSRLLVPENRVEPVREIASQLTDLPDAVEPFERIREAIKEAQSQIARTSVPRTSAAA
jgi:hypothetical protein